MGEAADHLARDYGIVRWAPGRCTPALVRPGVRHPGGRWLRRPRSCPSATSPATTGPWPRTGAAADSLGLPPRRHGHRRPLLRRQRRRRPRHRRRRRTHRRLGAPACRCWPPRRPVPLDRPGLGIVPGHAARAGPCRPEARRPRRDRVPRGLRRAGAGLLRRSGSRSGEGLAIPRAGRCARSPWCVGAVLPSALRPTGRPARRLRARRHRLAGVRAWRWSCSPAVGSDPSGDGASAPIGARRAASSSETSRTTAPSTISADEDRRVDPPAVQHRLHQLRAGQPLQVGAGRAALHPEQGASPTANQRPPARAGPRHGHEVAPGVAGREVHPGLRGDGGHVVGVDQRRCFSRSGYWAQVPPPSA